MLDVVKSGLLGLDRKAMEEERLARVRKRAAAIGDAQQQAAKTAIPSDFSRRSVSPKTNPFKKRAAENLDSDDAGRPSKALRIDNNNDGQSTNSSSRTANPQPTISQAGKFGVCATNNTDIRYPNGAVKRSCSTAHDPSNTVTLSSVLQSSTLTTAVISSWQMDFDYLATKIDPKRTKFVFVLEAKTPTDKTRWQQDFAGLEKSIRLCFPPISGNLYARMHSKLMLLFHKSHLRIVVTSANMTAHDWGESGLLENMVFLIDLPRHAGVSSDSLPREKGSFEQELLKFMDATGLPDDVKTGVSNFDFSATHNMAFTHSIPGNYETNGEHDTGILGLAKVVRHLRCGAAFGAPTSIDVASASLGGLDDKQISTFASAFKGVTPFAETTTQKPPPGQAFNIVFPTHETVKNSRGGENAAGTIFLQTSTVLAPKFPRHLLHDYKSTRKGLLSHNKLILFRSTNTAYFYTGSANLSQSAWGRLSYPKTTGKVKLFVANWECGVLVPVVQRDKEVGEELKEGRSVETAIALDDMDDEGTGSKVSKAAVLAQPWIGAANAAEILPYSVFDGVVDIPFECPPRAYKPDQPPWMQ